MYTSLPTQPKPSNHINAGFLQYASLVRKKLLLRARPLRSGFSLQILCSDKSPISRFQQQALSCQSLRRCAFLPDLRQGGFSHPSPGFLDIPLGKVGGCRVLTKGTTLRNRSYPQPRMNAMNNLSL